MNSFRKIRVNTALIIVAAIFLTGCGVSSLPKSKNDVEANVAEVTNQYKRRADLIPNLVKTVKGYASHESETLQAVVEARAKASSAQIDPSNVTPAQLQKFQSAQGGLSSAMSRLMVVVEKYPDLKADQNFRELQAQLEGTENRIAVARNRHIASIKRYNDLVTAPPESWTNSLFYHYEKMPQWNVGAEEKVKNEAVPSVEF
jgi:LemA protein